MGSIFLGDRGSEGWSEKGGGKGFRTLWIFVDPELGL